MASLRRSNALSTDNQTAKFLYTILKQLDLKAIDWNQVAEGLDITNGHAARMRFSRFKQHMEGIPTQPRAARPKKDGSKDAKGGKGKSVKRSLDDDIKGDDVKSEQRETLETRIKPDPGAQIEEEPSWESDTSETRVPPAVRVKREIEMDENISEAVIGSTKHTLPAQQHPTAPASFAFAPAPRSDPVAFSTMSAPVSTVSLADVELSPKSLSPVPRFANSIPPIAVARGNALAPTRSAIHVKKEPDLADIRMLEADAPIFIKSEPKIS